MAEGSQRDVHRTHETLSRLPHPDTDGLRRRFDEMMLRRHLKDLKKGKTVETHVEKVQRLNDYLSKLSEHHDIPKVDGSW